MKNSNRFYFCQAIFLTILIIFAFTQCSNRNDIPAEKKSAARSSSVDEIELSREVKSVLEKKKKLLHSFCSGEVLLELVTKVNNSNKSIPLNEILARDKQWQKTDGLDDFIKSFITNDCAQVIFQFQQEHDEFTEIFITDSRGAIIGETNRTSDYYQADEAWWQKTYNQGKGLSYYGEIEYDDSSKTEAIPIYMPIIDPKSQQVLGVMKAVLAIAAIKTEL